MKQIELIRAGMVRRFGMQLDAVRMHLSTTGNEELLDLLREQQRARILAELVERVLEHLGYETEVKANGPRAGDSQTRRLIAKQRG
jgi:DNA-binding transcriptional ArsR family regulator